MFKLTLKAARITVGLTLKEAAEKFNINPRTLAKYEFDSTHVPRSFFIMIESVYGIPVEYIYFGRQSDFLEEIKEVVV